MPSPHTVCRPMYSYTQLKIQVNIARYVGLFLIGRCTCAPCPQKGHCSPLLVMPATNQGTRAKRHSHVVKGGERGNMSHSYQHMSTCYTLSSAIYDLYCVCKIHQFLKTNKLSSTRQESHSLFCLSVCLYFLSSCISVCLSVCSLDHWYLFSVLFHDILYDPIFGQLMSSDSFTANSLRAIEELIPLILV